MKTNLKKSVTLIELIICLVLIGMISLSFWSIHIFSRYHLVTAVRRAKLQNEVSYVLSHMTKNIGRAIGDIENFPVRYVNPTLRVRVDSNLNGILETSDGFIAYEYGASPHRLQYCDDFNNVAGNCNNAYESLSAYITSDLGATNVDFNSNINYVDVNISACWDASLSSCGSSENPVVNMSSAIKMPAVSVK